MILFFVLSGFLITSILLEARGTSRTTFTTFMRAGRCASGQSTCCCWWWFTSTRPGSLAPASWDAIKTAPWLAYIFFVQNLFHLTLPPAIGPTWALAIEEQYYFLWAPLVRFLRQPWMLAAVLAAALVASPLLRHANLHWMTPTNTLIHLDGIALRQPAGDWYAHPAAEPPRVARHRTGPVRPRHCGRGHHRRRHGLSGFRAGRWFRRRDAGRSSHPQGRAIPSTSHCAAGRWLFMAASATASI